MRAGILESVRRQRHDQVSVEWEGGKGKEGIRRAEMQDSKDELIQSEGLANGDDDMAYRAKQYSATEACYDTSRPCISTIVTVTTATSRWATRYIGEGTT
jgi:hypothetical protein